MLQNYEFSFDIFLDKIKNYLLKSDTTNYLDFEKRKIILNVSREDLDSLDNIFLNLNKKIRKENGNGWSSDETDEHNKILFNYLNNKPCFDVHIVRCFSYLKFDFRNKKKKME